MSRGGRRGRAIVGFVGLTLTDSTLARGPAERRRYEGSVHRVQAAVADADTDGVAGQSARPQLVQREDARLVGDKTRDAHVRVRVGSAGL
jgi:hypothetical protein